MASQQGYGQFCPVAMATEVLGTRWTILVLRELLCGSTRFNELRRGVPRMSPALLSKRLGELETHGLITRRVDADSGAPAYRLTEAGEELRPTVMSLGSWGQRWLESQLSLRNLDPSLLMWDMRRNLDTTPVPRRRVVIEFIYPELPESQRKWWLIVEPDRTVDLCHIDPGFDVDLYATVDLRTMTEIWMGLRSVADAVNRETLLLVGSPDLKRSMQTWLGLSPFAQQEKLAS